MDCACTNVYTTEAALHIYNSHITIPIQHEKKTDYYQSWNKQHEYCYI